jgi:hypothetical protein
MPGLPIVQPSSQGWASVGAMWSTSLNEGWIPDVRLGSTGGFTAPVSPTSSAGSFTSTGDGSTGTGNGLYTPGRAVRVVQGGTARYATVFTASFGGGITTVRLATDALTTGAITSAAVGPAFIDNLPIGLRAAVGCRVYKTSAQSCSNNVETAILWDAEDYDTDAIHSTVTNSERFTVPAGLGGKWELVLQGRWAGNATGLRYMECFVNGSGMSADKYLLQEDSAQASAFIQRLVGTLNLVAGDYIEIRALQNSGVSLNVTNPYMTCEFFRRGA